MTNEQKTVKIFAYILAALICISVFSAIVGGIGFIASWFDSDFDEPYVPEKLNTANIDIEKIDELDIEIKSSSLEIKSGSDFSINKDSSNSELDIRVKGSSLIISERHHGLWFRKRSGKVIIVLPDTKTLEKLQIDQGAGRITIDDISTSYFELDQGAGTLDINNCEFDHTDIDGGVGKLTVRNSSIKNLDLDAGVGSIDMEAKLLGRTDIDGGVGSIELTIQGRKEDYAFNIEKGLGSVTVDGDSVSGNFGTGSNRVEIDGGVGSIRVKFD